MIKVTQDNLYLLLPGKITQVIKIISEALNITAEDALHKFYKSKVYQNLALEETKYWHLGPVCLAQEFLDENESLS